MGNLLVQPLRLPVVSCRVLVAMYPSSISFMYLAKHHACCLPRVKPLAWLHDPLAAIWQN